MRGIIGALVAIIISMLIGIIVVSTIINSVNTSGWSSEAQSTWQTLTSNIWVAFSLLVILPLIVGAVMLMKVIGGEGGEI